MSSIGMTSKKSLRIPFKASLELFLFFLLFISLNIVVLSLLEEKFSSRIISLLRKPPHQTITRTPTDLKNIDIGQIVKEKKEAIEEKENVQIISLEEDGRFGNLLMETATLLLIGQKHNVSVSILPQVSVKLSKYLSHLPANVIDHTKHCVCTHCTDCLCPTCNKWTKVPSWTYMKSPSSYKEKYLLLKWFNSDLVLRHIDELRSQFRPLLRKDIIEDVQSLFKGIQAKRGFNVTFISIHVRRTDYIQWIENRYKGKAVDGLYFKYCMDKFRQEEQNPVFVVTSDDMPWCKENLQGEDVIFPGDPRNGIDPIVRDFIILSQSNHSIYDYGSFGFWGALLAGGKTMVADGYSKKTHPILAAIRKANPVGWTRVDVSTI